MMKDRQSAVLNISSESRCQSLTSSDTSIEQQAENITTPEARRFAEIPWTSHGILEGGAGRRKYRAAHRGQQCPMG